MCTRLLRAFRTLYIENLILKIDLNNFIIMSVFSNLIDWVLNNAGFLLENYPKCSRLPGLSVFSIANSSDSNTVL
jgi:hypothetical protein